MPGQQNGPPQFPARPGANTPQVQRTPFPPGTNGHQFANFPPGQGPPQYPQQQQQYPPQMYQRQQVR